MASTNRMPDNEAEAPPKPRTIFSNRPDLRNVKHPSAIKLIPVAKTEDVDIEEDNWVGLTKYQLVQCIDDPFWVRTRQVFLWLFVLSFFLMLGAAALIIVKAPPVCTAKLVLNATDAYDNSTAKPVLNVIDSHANSTAKPVLDATDARNNSTML